MCCPGALRTQRRGPHQLGSQDRLLGESVSEDRWDERVMANDGRAGGWKGKFQAERTTRVKAPSPRERVVQGGSGGVPVSGSVPAGAPWEGQGWGRGRGLPWGAVPGSWLWLWEVPQLRAPGTKAQREEGTSEALQPGLSPFCCIPLPSWRTQGPCQRGELLQAGPRGCPGRCRS